PAEQRLRVAGPAQVGPLAKGLCGPGLLAYVLTAKFADHVPLHRLAGQLGRSGVHLAPSTLGDWLTGAAELLDPLYQLMHQRLLHSRALHGDDTAVKLRVPRRGRGAACAITAAICTPMPWRSTRGCMALSGCGTCAAGRTPAASSWPHSKPGTSAPPRRWPGSGSCMASSA